MNERFLYRGKHIIDDKWIIGNVVEFAGLTQIWVDCNTHSKSSIVNPHTIGQCTGMRDKNGTLIFEGDMLRVTNWRRIGAVTFCRAMFKFDNVSLCTFFGDKDYSVEVVGNIHDNADLLEAGKASG